MRHLCVTILSLWAAFFDAPCIQETPWLRVEITMAEDGFMCPFLTPMFIGILEDKGAEWVICRPELSKVEFCVGLEHARSQEGYVDWLTDLGYAESQIAFGVFDTLSVMPPIPTP